jgi:HEAT repeat protein
MAQAPAPSGHQSARYVRIWKSASGNHDVLAVLVGYDRGVVYLRDAKWNLLKVDQQKLSVGDRQLLAAWKVAELKREHNGKTLDQWIGELESDDPRAVSVAALAIKDYGPAATNAIPTLMAIMEHRRAFDKTFVGQALHSVGPSVIGGLIKKLADDNELARHNAANMLRRFGSAAVGEVSALAKALENPDRVVRFAVTHTLDEIGPRAVAALPALRKLIKETGSRSAIYASYRIDPASPETVLAIVNYANERTRGSRSRSNERPRTQIESLGALLNLFESGDAPRANVAKLIREIYPLGEAAAARIGSLLRHEDAETRRHAASMLRWFRGAKARSLAIGAISDSDPAVRVEALEAYRSYLRRFPKDPSVDKDPPVDIVVKALRDVDPKVHAAALACLTGMEPRHVDVPAVHAVLPLILEKMEKSSGRSREGYIRLASYLRSQAPQIVPRIVADLEGDDRSSAVYALERLGPVAVPALVKLLDGSDVKLQQTVVRLLGKSGWRSASAIPALVKLLDSDDKSLRREALDALRDIGPASDGEWLKATASQHADVRAGALASLPPGGVPLDVLNKASKDENARVQITAARRLLARDPASKEGRAACVSLLESENSYVRRNAAIELIKMGDRSPRVMEVIGKAARSPSSIMTLSEPQVLSDMGTDAAPITKKLVAIVGDEKKKLSERSAVAESLWRFGPSVKEHVPALLKVLKSIEGKGTPYRFNRPDEFASLRGSLVHLLWHLDKNEYAVSTAIEMRQKGGSHDVDRLLSSMGPAAKAVVPTLHKQLSGLYSRQPDRDIDIERTSLAILLWRIAQPEVSRRIIHEALASLDSRQYFRHFHPFDDRVYIDGGVKGLESLLSKSLENENWSMRFHAAVFLSQAEKKEPRSVPVLIEGLGRSDKKSQRRAIYALRQLGPLAKPAIPELAKFLKHGDMNTRLEAVLTLLKIDEQYPVVPALVEILRSHDIDPNGWGDRYQSTASYTLGRLGPKAKAAVPILVAHLRKEPNRNSIHAYNALASLDREAARRLAVELANEWP